MWYSCQVTKQKKEYWGLLDIDVLFFSKKNCTREITFLQCLCYCWCCANNDFHGNDFYDITFKDYMLYSSKKQLYSSKENRVREIHLNKVTLQSWWGQRNVY